MEVTVENKRTGHRKKMTALMARNLESKYRIITDESVGFIPPKETKSEIEKLREQYFIKFGQQPHHRLGIIRLKELISAKQME